MLWKLDGRAPACEAGTCRFESCSEHLANVAQRLAHLPDTQEVGGSNPPVRTVTMVQESGRRGVNPEVPVRVRLVTPLEEAERRGGGFMTRRKMVRLHPSRRRGRIRGSSPQIKGDEPELRRASKTCRSGFDSSVACRSGVAHGEEQWLSNPHDRVRLPDPDPRDVAQHGQRAGFGVRKTMVRIHPSRHGTLGRQGSRRWQNNGYREGRPVSHTMYTACARPIR